MWLLDTARAELHFFANPEDVPEPGFCVLSHTWGANEQTFQDVQKIREECKKTGENPRNVVSEKIRMCCELAEKDGYSWVWNDTCCINKDSSAELSEAINSMFRYYTLSGLCYAYLEDVPAIALPKEPGPRTLGKWWHTRWNTRGWTLQELIAPETVLFFSSAWVFLGSKADYAQLLEKSLHIPASLLLKESELSSFSVAQRFSWAAHRVTSRKEDEAYCLLGIFDINMPTLYGEGSKAFLRLQQEILRSTPDTTLFAWGLGHRSIELFNEGNLGRYSRLPLFAPSCKEFSDSQQVRWGKRNWSNGEFQKGERVDKGRTVITQTAHGIRAVVPLAVIKNITLVDLSWYIEQSSDSQHRIYLVLTPYSEENTSSSETLWYAVEYEHSWHLAVLIPDDSQPVWKMVEIYIASHNNANHISITGASSRPLPPVCWPCNRSYLKPFHFHFKQTPDFYVRRVLNAESDWRKTDPVILHLSYRRRSRPVGDANICIRFGVCTAYAMKPPVIEQSYLDRPIIHWVRADLGFKFSEHREHPWRPADAPIHDCTNDHVTDFYIVTNVKLGQVEGLSGGQHLFTYTLRIELTFGWTSWSAHTLVLNNILFHEILSLQEPRHDIGHLCPDTNRILLHTSNPFPINDAGSPIEYDQEGSIYLASAITDANTRAIRPGRIILKDNAIPKVLVLDENGDEIQHVGYYYLLRFEDERMCWVSPTFESRMPGWSQYAILGGWERPQGRKMHHACTIEHKSRDKMSLGYIMESSGMACVAEDGVIKRVRHYWILCWKTCNQDTTKRNSNAVVQKPLSEVTTDR